MSPLRHPEHDVDQAPHAPQPHVEVHVRVWLHQPPDVQPLVVCVVPGAQAPSPMHVPQAPHASHAQPELHVRLCD